MLTEGPADGASDVEIVASMVSLDKRQRGRRNVNMYRQEKKEKLETKGSAFHSKVVATPSRGGGSWSNLHHQIRRSHGVAWRENYP